MKLENDDMSQTKICACFLCLCGQTVDMKNNMSCILRKRAALIVKIKADEDWFSGNNDVNSTRKLWLWIFGGTTILKGEFSDLVLIGSYFRISRAVLDISKINLIFSVFLFTPSFWNEFDGCSSKKSWKRFGGKRSKQVLFLFLFWGQCSATIFGSFRNFLYYF